MAGPARVAYTAADRVGATGFGDALELLAHGLTFELEGLAPAASAPLPEIAHRYGLVPDYSFEGLEAVQLRAGAHLRGAENLLPVVRALAGVAATLATLPDLAAIAWAHARSAMGPEAFVRGTTTWLDGGAFPALGFTALVALPDGTFRSEGLAFFTGQEIELAPLAGRSPRDSARICVRLIDALIGADPLRESTRFTGPEGELLVAEISGKTNIIHISSMT